MPPDVLSHLQKVWVSGQQLQMRALAPGEDTNPAPRPFKPRFDKRGPGGPGGPRRGGPGGRVAMVAMVATAAVTATAARRVVTASSRAARAASKPHPQPSTQRQPRAGGQKGDGGD
jgi:hypothetical protein